MTVASGVTPPPSTAASAQSAAQAAVPTSSASSVLPSPPPAMPAKAALSQQQLVLPVGCSTFGTATQQIVVCQPVKDSWYEKLLPSVPALLVSFVALLVSLRSFRYSQKKDNRARRQSIIDDYWLRKIVSPVSIEPLLKLSTELAAKLPSEPTTPAAVQAYWSEQTKKSEELSIGFQGLKLIDDRLSGDVELKLQSLDDVLATYCGALQVFLAAPGGSKPDREQAIRGIHDACLGIFTVIKQHQEAVGEDPVSAFSWKDPRTWRRIWAARQQARNSSA